MQRSIIIAVGMTVVLFLYGYCVTELGHEHDEHAETHEEHAHNH